jgi:hypothetical protein
VKKALGLAVALTLALPLAAGADEMWGTIRYTNPADRSIILDDGTKLWVSEGQFAELSSGDQVKASFETTGDKTILTQVYRRVAPDGTLDPLESEQTGD